MPYPLPPQSLDDLLARAEDFALFSMRSGGKVPPSESLHRREVVILTGESRTGAKQKILPIVRTDAGGFFGFGEFEGPDATSFQGRFAQILPPKRPSTEIQTQARTLLAAMGVTAAALRRDWSDN